MVPTYRFNEEVLAANNAARQAAELLLKAESFLRNNIGIPKHPDSVERAERDRDWCLDYLRWQGAL